MPVQLKGFEALQKQLKALDEDLAAKVMRGSLRKAFQPVLEAAKALAPRDTGVLAESLVLGVARPKGEETLAVGVMVGRAKEKQARIAAAAFNEGQSKKLSPAKRWHFVELGTSKQAARPFLRPALDGKVAQVIDGLRTELAKRIARAIKRGK